MSRALPKEKTLAFQFPEVAVQWHPKKNQPLTPEMVTPGSGKKVWWQCGRGHEYDMAVYSKTGGRGCPYCSGYRVGPDNNLAFVRDDLAAEWHVQKNKQLMPEHVYFSSTKKVWWKCSKGHEWKAGINRRVEGTGCPYCAGQRISTDNNLAARNPVLAKEWHPTRNRELTPNDVMPGTHKKVWWLCKKGHEWSSPVVDRSAGQGCPFCAGKRVSPDNNLAFRNPDLAKEWHPTRNGDLRPDQVTSGSNKKVWWICKRGHEWQTAVSNRARGAGCRQCSSQTSKPEIRLFTELEAVFGDVSRRKVFDRQEVDVYLEKYRIGVEYDGRFYHKDSETKDKRKNDLLRRNGIKIIRIREKPLGKISEADLCIRPSEFGKKTINELLRQISPQCDRNDKKTIDAYINKKTYWASKKYKTLLSYLPGPPPESSLQALHSSVASDWHPSKNKPLEPSQFSPGSNHIVWWLCSNGHEWQAMIIERTRGNGCPYCSGHRVSKENCLSEIAPLLAAEWHPTKNKNLTATEVTGRSGKVVWWQCKKGHEWRASVDNRFRNRGCPYCSNKRVCEDNNLATVNPKLAKEWHRLKNSQLRPTQVLLFSNRKVWWQCANGHEWEAVIANRSQGRGCPYCAGKLASDDNSVASQYPEITKEWHPSKNVGITPEQVVAGSDRKVWWKCANGHEWKAQIKSRTAGTGCPYCSGRFVTEGNSLQELYPKIAEQWHQTRNSPLTPSDVSKGSGKKVWWKCPRGHEWQAKVLNRVYGKTGCPVCYRLKTVKK